MDGLGAIARILYTPEEIAERVRGLAAEIAADVGEERPVLIAVLKGSLIFMADLSRALGAPADIDFMIVSEFEGGAGHTGVVRIIKDLDIPIEGRYVVIVETVVDTGLSLAFLMRTLEHRRPRTLRVCALISKPARRIAQPGLDYVGFETDEYLVGYGLDFRRRYRNLAYLVGVNDVGSLAEDPDAVWAALEDR